MVGTPGEYATGLKQFDFPSQWGEKRCVTPRPRDQPDAGQQDLLGVGTQCIHDKLNVLLGCLRGKL